MSSVERPLGLLEKYQLSKQETGAYGNITLSVGLEHVSIGQEAVNSFYSRHFYPVLVHLIQEHPALSMVIRDKEKSTVHFEQLFRIDLSQVVDIAATSEQVSWRQLIEEQVDAEFDNESLLPLWRLKVIADSPTTCILHLTLHHAIGDGMTLSIFMQSFLQELVKENTHKELASKVLEVEKSECPAPYELSNAPAIHVVWDVVPVLVKSILPKVAPKPLLSWIDPFTIGGWKGDFPAVEGEHHNTQVDCIHIPEDVWKPITLECKKQGISAHALEFAAMLKAWHSLYPDQMTEVATPINCRGLCNPPVSSDKMGNFVGAYTSFWTVNELNDTIWNIAKKYHQNLQQNKLNAGKQSLFLKYLSDYPSSFIEFWHDKRKGSDFGRTGGLELSDLGKSFTLCDNNKWKVKQAYFCQSAQIFTNAFSMNSISINHQLYATLCWQKGSLSEKILEFNHVFYDILKSTPL